MKLWWYAILMLGLQLPLTAAAEENATETVPVNEFRLALALGYGRLDNPRVHAKPIETFLLPSWSYYSERFYLENFTLGYSLYESDNWLFDLQTKLNEDGFFFEFDGLNKLFLSDIIASPPTRDRSYAPTVTANLSLTKSSVTSPIWAEFPSLGLRPTRISIWACFRTFPGYMTAMSCSSD